MKEMFKSVLKVARQTERIIKDGLQFRNAWDTNGFEYLNEKLRKSKFKSNSSLIDMSRQLSSLTTAQNVDSAGKKDEKKRKAEDSKSDPSNAHKKKAKKNVETWGFIIYHVNMPIYIQSRLMGSLRLCWDIDSIHNQMDVTF